MKTFLEEAWKAISDLKFYKEVRNFSTAKSFKYLLLFVFIITLILSIVYTVILSKGLNIAADWMKKNLPVIEIQNGVASVNAEEPYKITQNDITVILDTTGKTTSLDEYKQGILLLKDKVIYKESNAKTEIYSLAEIKSLRIDENFINAIKKNAGWIIFPFMLLGIYLYFIIARLIQVLLFSIVTIFASAVGKAQLGYGQIFSIGTYAITLSMLLGAISALFMKPIPGFGWIYAAIYAAYLIGAVMNCKEA